MYIMYKLYKMFWEVSSWERNLKSEKSWLGPVILLWFFLTVTILILAPAAAWTTVVRFDVGKIRRFERLPPAWNSGINYSRIIFFVYIEIIVFKIELIFLLIQIGRKRRCTDNDLPDTLGQN